MKKSVVISRFIIPVFVALIVLVLSRLIFFNSVCIDSQTIYHLVALVSGIIHFLSICFVTSILYPVTFFRGATWAERIVACSINPLIWVIVEIYNVNAAFTFWESLYLGLNIGTVILLWNFTLMGICEILCRLVLKKRVSEVKVFTFTPFIPMGLFAFMIYVLSKENGAYCFYLLCDGYIALFRSG